MGTSRHQTPGAASLKGDLIQPFQNERIQISDGKLDLRVYLLIPSERRAAVMLTCVACLLLV